MQNDLSNGQSPVDPEVDLKNMIEKCLEAPAYLIFTARITSNRNEKGENIVEFDYRRFHFAIEDARQAIASLKNFVDEEIQKLLAQEEFN